MFTPTPDWRLTAAIRSGAIRPYLSPDAPYANVSAFGVPVPPPLPEPTCKVTPLADLYRRVPVYDSIGTSLGIAPRYVVPAVARAVSGRAYTRRPSLRARLAEGHRSHARQSHAALTAR